MTNYDKRPATPDFIQHASALCPECRGSGVVKCAQDDPKRMAWVSNANGGNVKWCSCRRPVVETR